MKKSSAMLMLTVISGLILNFTCPAHADVSSYNNWSWLVGAGDSVILNVKADTNWVDGYSLSLVGTDGSLTLVSKTKTSTDFTITNIGGVFSATDGSGTVAIQSSGSNALLKFNFSDGTNSNMLYTYSLIYTDPDDDTLKTYLLATSTKFLNARFETTASPVPIPGSALLLGSSLLGLVGISTRKKKA